MPSHADRALDKDAGRLPSGDPRKMLRRAAGEIRPMSGPSGLGARDQEGA